MPDTEEEPVYFVLIRDNQDAMSGADLDNQELFEAKAHLCTATYIREVLFPEHGAAIRRICQVGKLGGPTRWIWKQLDGFTGFVPGDLYAVRVEAQATDVGDKDSEGTHVGFSVVVLYLCACHRSDEPDTLDAAGMNGAVAVQAKNCLLPLFYTRPSACSLVYAHTPTPASPGRPVATHSRGNVHAKCRSNHRAHRGCRVSRCRKACLVWAPSPVAIASGFRRIAAH